MSGSAAQHLFHLALDSGQTSRSHSDEVLSESMADLRLTLDEALASAAAVPWEPSYTIRARQQGRCLLCTLAGPSGNLVTFAVAGRSRCGAGVWAELLDGRPYRTNPERQPAVPWCAWRLELGSQSDRAAMGWVPDFMKAVAWTWLHRPAEA